MYYNKFDLTRNMRAAVRDWDWQNIISAYRGELLDYRAAFDHKGQVEKFPHEIVAAAFADPVDHDRFVEPEFFVGYHRLVGHGCDRDKRCAVILRSDDALGAVNAVLQVKPGFVNDRLRIRVDLRLKTYLTGGLAAMIAELPEKYSALRANGGRALIEEVVLKHGDRAIALEEKSTDEAGVFFFEAPMDSLSLADLNFHVKLRFFDQVRWLDTELWDGAAAKLHRYALRETEKLNSLLGTDPSRSDLMLALAAAQEDSGQVDDAWETTRRILANSPGEGNLWLQGATMYQDLGFDDRAVAILDEAVAANPDQGKLWSSLAKVAYKMENYRRAAEAYDALLRIRPGDNRFAWWRAAFLLLDGQFKPAGSFFAVAGSDYRPAQTFLFRYLAAARSDSDDLRQAERIMNDNLLRLIGDAAQDREDIASSLSLALSQMEAGASFGPEDICMVRMLDSWFSLVADKVGEGRRKLDTAVAQCPKGGIEYRLAKAERVRIDARQ